MKNYAFVFCLLGLLSTPSLNAQTTSANPIKPLSKNLHYTGQNAHSHNDYQQPHPFVTAYNATFGSVEADIFLEHDSLYVGHTIQDVQLHKTLSSLYLDPLAKQINLHNGCPYNNKNWHLQLLIDLKTEGVSTLAALVQLLKRYPAIIHSKAIHIVITGIRPPVKDWSTYPDFIMFDGNIGETYSLTILPKIAMMSGDFANFIKWDGNGQIPKQDSLKIVSTITAVHAKGKKIRFWDAPDVANAWLHFMDWGVDWINTDHIEALATYMLHRLSMMH